MIRKQFTCYLSYYEAIKRLGNRDRLKAYDLLMEYALCGTEPRMEELPNAVAMAFLLMKPTLDAAWTKAMNRLSKTKENSLQPVAEQTDNKKESKKESKSKSECECKSEYEYDYKYIIPSCAKAPDKAFDAFWNAYPRKENKKAAYAAFLRVGVPVIELLDAVQAQKKLPQWQRDAGRYIPSPDKWLRDRRWEDQPSECGTIPVGSLELQAMRRMIASQ